MKIMYQRMIISLLAAIVPVITFFSLLIWLGYAPLFTNSISFDAKMKYINSKELKQLDLAIVGSSITLNNLSSKVIKDSLDMSFFNFSCWGLQMNDTKEVINESILLHKPKFVLISSSITDFETPGNLVSIKNYYSTADLFKEKFTAYFFLGNYNSILDIIIRKRTEDKLQKSTDQYNSLNFDTYGGVLLPIPRRNISAERWNIKEEFPTSYTNDQYKSLTSLCKVLEKNNIKLIFAQSPIKKAYVSSDTLKEALKNHFVTCKNIIQKHHGVYLNFYNTIIFGSDSLFVDQFHLSPAGASLYTKQITHSLREAHIIHY